MSVEPRPLASGHRHETSDVHVRGVLIFGAALCATIALTLLGMSWLFSYYAGKHPAGSPASLIAPGGEIPPKPRLQTSALSDLTSKQNAEDAVLNSYGWVDRRQGIVRIPIEQAIDLLARQGLPSRTSPAGAATENR